MNKTKMIKAITIVILTVMLLFTASNIAYGYVGSEGISQIANSGLTYGALGQTISIRATEMIDRPIYCIQFQQRFTDQYRTTYTIEKCVEINGSQATSYYYSNGNEQQATATTNENMVLSYILSGEYGVGYGTAFYGRGDFTQTQKGLYTYYNSWLNSKDVNTGRTIADVLGLGGFYNNDNYVNLGGTIEGTELVNRAKEAAANGFSGGVRIYFLRNRGGNAQRLIIAQPIEGPKTGNLVIDKVDIDTQERMPGIGFTVRSLTKGYIKSVDVNNDNKVTAYTSNESEAYEFITGQNNSYNTITITELEQGDYVIKEVRNPYEEYNTENNIGKEETVHVNGGATFRALMTNRKKNVSLSGRVWEDLFSGKANDNNSIMDANEKGVPNVKVYWKESNGTVIAETVTDADGYYSFTSDITLADNRHNFDSDKYSRYNNSYIEFEYNGLKYMSVKSTTSKDANASKATETAVSRKALDDNFDEVTKNVVKDGNYNLSYNTVKSEEGATSILNQSITDFTVKATTAEAGLTRIFEIADTDSAENKWNITNINLGIVEREQPDIALKADIENVKVVTNGQVFTYEYNLKKIREANIEAEYKVAMGNKYEDTYKRPVNPVYRRAIDAADLAYLVSSNKADYLQVYVTYGITIVNQSGTTPIKVQEVVNYYDGNYTLESTDNWKETSKYGDKYSTDTFKAAYTTQIKDEIIGPGQKSSTMLIEFKVNDDVIRGLLNNDAPLKNISEINIYSSYYGNTTICSNGKTADELGLTNTQRAAVDLNSAPGNAVPGDVTTYEEDTDEAPTFLLTKNDKYKTISGMVWEDTDVNTVDAERLGNGLKDNGEAAVANVKVELIDENGNTAKLYKLVKDGDSYKPEMVDAIAYTADDGTYTLGNVSEEGIAKGKYSIKYTYGDNETVIQSGATTIENSKINGRNYKSTIVTEESVKNAIQGNDNQYWYFETSGNGTVAVDNLSLRKDISKDLTYKTFNETLNMESNTPSFIAKIENIAENGMKVKDENGEVEASDNLGMFNLGIIKMPKEEMVVNKTVEGLKITLANGQVLTEGNPYRDKMNWVKALGTDVKTRQESLSAQDKLVSIEVDSELIQGATVEIEYAITVTNNNEIDYDYTKGNSYYYFGDKANLPVIEGAAEYLVDYEDSEITVSTVDENGENNTWLKVSAEDLESKGLISEATKERLEQENYGILLTDAFKDLKRNESKTEHLKATKLLANQADNYTYENHSEIIKINGNVARTIDIDENQKQVAKMSKPGNYIPSTASRRVDFADASIEEAGVHQIDDDRVIVTITPPTGILSNIITYVVVIMVALIVAAGGVYLIKNKVLGK